MVRYIQPKAEHLESHRQLKCLAVHHFCVVDVEKVRVDNGLKNTGQNGHVVEASFKEVPVDPVGNVQCSVNAQGENVMGGDVFGRACSLQHVQLWDNGHGLQPDGKGPRQFPERVGVVENQRDYGNGNKQEFERERIYVLADGAVVLLCHQVNGVCRGQKEEKLHERVVKRNIAGEQV